MSRTAVIMQPTYLPWLGYFDLIDQSDVFVFLDHAQFSKQSWHQRNRIRTSKGLEWLTVPVRRSGRGFFTISEAEIAEGRLFPHNHLRAVEFNYERASYYQQYFPRLKELLTANSFSLGDLNIRLIRWISEELGLGAELLLSSTLEVHGKRSELMVDICRAVGADSCVSPVAAAAYLVREIDPARGLDIDLRFQNYEHPTYRQMFSPFIPFASVLDLLLNEGERSIDVIRSGRRSSRTMAEVLDGTSSGTLE